MPNFVMSYPLKRGEMIAWGILNKIQLRLTDKKIKKCISQNLIYQSLVNMMLPLHLMMIMLVNWKILRNAWSEI